MNAVCHLVGKTDDCESLLKSCALKSRNFS
jgi:hypothetical protein